MKYLFAVISGLFVSIAFIFNAHEWLGAAVVSGFACLDFMLFDNFKK